MKGERLGRNRKPAHSLVIDLGVLTAAAAHLEVALLVASLERDPAWVTGVLLGCFHGGYFAADWLGAASGRRLLASASVGLMWLAAWPLLPTLALAPGVLLVSASIQAMRRRLKPHAGLTVTSKQLAKLLGMVSAGIAVLPIGIELSCLALGSGVLLASSGLPSPTVSRRSTRERIEPKLRLALLFMEFLHHAHYFMYCYVFWRLIPLAHGLVGAAFIVGWLAYFFLERFHQSHRSFSPLMIAAGHALAAGAIFGMSQTSDVLVMLLLWFLTGVGGGTAYMMGNGPQVPERERAEDAGHTVGTVVGGFVASAVSISAAVGAAAIVAITTSALAVVVNLVLSGRKQGTDAD
jgi:hypothetical protein